MTNHANFSAIFLVERRNDMPNHDGVISIAYGWFHPVLQHCGQKICP